MRRQTAGWVSLKLVKKHFILIVLFCLPKKEPKKGIPKRLHPVLGIVPPIYPIVWTHYCIALSTKRCRKENSVI